MIIVIKNTLTDKITIHEIEPNDDLDLDEHEIIIERKQQTADCYYSDDTYGSRPGEYDHRHELYLSERDAYNDRYENEHNQF